MKQRKWTAAYEALLLCRKHYPWRVLKTNFDVPRTPKKGRS